MKTNASNSGPENIPPVSPGTPPNGAIWDRVERATRKWLELNLPKLFRSWMNSPDGGQSVVRETLTSATSGFLQDFLTKLDERIGKQEDRLEARRSEFLPKLVSEVRAATAQSVEVRRGWQYLLWGLLIAVAIPVVALTVLKLKEGYLSEKGRHQVQVLENRISELSVATSRLEKQLQISRIEWRQTSDSRIWVKVRPGSEPDMQLNPNGSVTPWVEVQLLK